jgi:hypothetical protein
LETAVAFGQDRLDKNSAKARVSLCFLSTHVLLFAFTPRRAKMYQALKDLFAEFIG